MSIDYYVHIGWMAAFKENEEIQTVGSTQVRVCPKNENHPNFNAFCPMCGSEIINKDIPKEQTYPSAYELFYDIEKKSNEEIQKLTFGKLTKEDFYILHETSIAQDQSKPGHIFIFTDSSVCLSDVTRSSKSYIPLVLPAPPTEAWLEGIKKIFNVEEVTLQYGAVIEAN